MLTTYKIPQLQQALYETLSWERMLDYFLQESAYIKIRLSQVTDATTDAAFIIAAEYFQTLFIDNDAHMTDLRTDVLRLQKSIQDCLLHEGHITQRITQQQRRITKDVLYFEKHFPVLRDEFNVFLEQWLRAR